MTVMESTQVVVDETNQIDKMLYQEEDLESPIEQLNCKQSAGSTASTSSIPTRTMKNQKLEDVIGDIKSGDMTRRQAQNLCAHY